MKVGPFGSQLSGNDFKNEGFWVYNQRTIVDENFSDNTVFIDASKYNSMRAFHVHAGDILVTTRGTIGRICQIPMNYNEGIIHPCVIKFRLSGEEIPFSFLKHIFNESNIVKEQLLFLSNATTIDVIYSGTLKDIKIPVPPRNVRKKISAFLDSQCSEIDAISADIQKEIEILEQYKRSVITEAVTKGLNPDAEMKDSGAEWIGKIPSNWKLEKGKYLFRQRNTKGNNISLQLLSPSQKYGVIPQTLLEKLTTQNVVKTNERADLGSFKTIHKGDFCISLRSFQGGFEYSEYEGIVSPAYQVFYKVKPLYNNYYRYLFKEGSFIKKMNSFTMTLRDGKNIAFSDFGDTYIPVPPLDEQEKIAAFLNKKSSEIDSLVAEKRQQLEVLDSYKKSLIYEYVTGKKEVAQ